MRLLASWRRAVPCPWEPPEVPTLSAPRQNVSHGFWEQRRVSRFWAMRTLPRAALFLGAMAMLGATEARAQSTLGGDWQFDDGHGLTAEDSSENENHGTLVGTPPPAWTAGRFEAALQFDQDYVSVPAAASLEPATVTVEAWVKAGASPGPFRYVLGKGGLSCLAASYALYTGSGGGLAFYVSDGSSFVVSPPAGAAQVWDGAWHHVAGSYDGTSVHLYLDGLDLGGTSGTLAINYQLAIRDLFIGQYPGQAFCLDRHDFVGTIDEVRVWDRALAAAEIAASAAMGAGSANELEVEEEHHEELVFTSHFTSGSNLVISLESSSGQRFITSVTVESARRGTAVLGPLAYANGGRTVSSSLTGTARSARLRVRLDDGSSFAVNVALNHPGSSRGERGDEDESED